MDINKLWTKIDLKFTNIANDLNYIKKDIVEIKNEQDLTKKIIDTLSNEQLSFKELQINMNKTINILSDKLNVLTNSNLAQILNEQRTFQNKFTEKLDVFILKNNTELKKFDYKIANLEMNIKIAN